MKRIEKGDRVMCIDQLSLEYGQWGTVERIQRRSTSMFGDKIWIRRDDGRTGSAEEGLWVSNSSTWRKE